MGAGTSLPPAWMCGLVFLLTAYLSIICFRQALRHRGELRNVYLVVSLLLLPLLLVAFFVYEGRLGLIFDRGNALNQDPANWWVVPIETKAGETWHLSLIGTAVTFSLLYILVTLSIATLSVVYFRRKGIELLSMHKAVIKWTLVVLGCVIILRIDLWTVLLGMGAASLVLGFALKEMLENLFTGMALEMEGAFHGGDWIRLGDQGPMGRVYEKNWRATKILTLDDESITIPNRMLGSDKILTYNRPVPTAWKLTVSASYRDPPVKVKEILRGILMRHPDVLFDPSPVVRTRSYDDFAITYQMKFCVNPAAQLQGVHDAIMTQVWYAFKFYDIEIPFPIRTVHVKERAEVREEEGLIEGEIQSRIDFLRKLDYYRRHLTFKDFDFLARNSFRRGYFPGEHIVQGGEIGDALYIIMEGWCDALLPGGRDVRLEVGQYFGEMGLLGERRRTVDVVAGENGATVLRTDKYCMDVLFRAYPELLEEFTQVRDIRLEELPRLEEVKDLAPVRPLRRVARYVVGFLRPW